MHWGYRSPPSEQMTKLEQKSRGTVETVRKALAQQAPARRRPSMPAANVSEDFRGARSALGQITADLERLRRHAASLVKATHRPAK
jgi:hypothetical protein